MLLGDAVLVNEQFNLPNFERLQLEKLNNFKTPVVGNEVLKHFGIEIGALDTPP